MDYLNILLPVLLYVFGIILLIVLIILGIRLIQILNKVDKVIDNVDEKVNSLNGLFNAIDKTSDTVALITDKMFTTISGAISRIFSRNKKKEESDYYE